MSQERLKNFYETKYDREIYSQPYTLFEPVAVPTDRFHAAVGSFIQHFKGGDVLEVGAGGGDLANSLLQAMPTQIASYTISDLSDVRVRSVRDRLADERVEILALDVETVKNFDRQYDAIIMVALIEHLIDPISAMSRLHKMLKPGGFIYIDTPNIAKYPQRLRLLTGRFPSTASRQEGLVTFSGEPVALFDEGHLHYFTYRSLSRMLIDRCGYSRIVKTGYPGGRIVLGKRVHGWLAKVWPEMFAELALIAYR